MIKKNYPVKNLNGNSDQSSGLTSLTLKRVFFLMAIFLVFLLIPNITRAEQFKLSLDQQHSRHWVGPDFYANRLEDWRLHRGRVECLTPAVNRYLYWLTAEVMSQGQLQISFKVSVPGLPERARARNFIGLRFGIKGRSSDFREAAVSGQGLDVGLTVDGLLFIGELESVSPEERLEVLKKALKKEVVLMVRLASAGKEFSLSLMVLEPETGRVLDELEDFALPAEKMTGGLALVSNLPEVKAGSENPVCWFKDFQAEGSLLRLFPERGFGPVAFVLYTLSRGTLKLTAQLVPESLGPQERVFLEIDRGDSFETLTEAYVNRESWTALFQIEGWEAESDFAYRIYAGDRLASSEATNYFSGWIRKEPSQAGRLTLAMLSNHQEEGYPYPELANSLKNHNPDLLIFAGNQVFGRPAALWRGALDYARARQEYLRQWLLFGWAFSDLLKDRPAILIPEARDFFQIKLWGEGGRPSQAEASADPAGAQDGGGFLVPSEFIKLVLETQTGHLPLTSKPAGEKAFYSGFHELNYAGLSLAVINDRFNKSAPGPLFPEARIRNGWPQNPDFDLKKATRVREARLLSEEQLGLLKDWILDWSGGVWFKACLSSSAFVSLLTLPEGQQGEEALWQLPPLKPGEYPESDRPAADFNTSAWPQPARDEIIRLLRKARAVHLCGTGGPPAVLKYGLEKPDEAIAALVASPIQAQVALRWTPAPARRSGQKKEAVATGNWEDAFGNKFNLLLVNNPRGEDKASGLKSISGFSLVTFEKSSRQVVFESYQLEEKPEVRPVLMPGWPAVVEQKENEGRKPVGYLPLLKFSGLKDPVVQVVEEKSGETVYCFRITGTEFRPPVYKPGIYSVKCGEPGTEQWKVLKGLRPQPEAVKKTLNVDFNFTIKK